MKYFSGPELAFIFMRQLCGWWQVLPLEKLNSYWTNHWFKEIRQEDLFASKVSLISLIVCNIFYEKLFCTSKWTRLWFSCLHFIDDKYVVTGEREHATALYMACKHLPPQLLSSPGERNGMLTEAARTLEKIGDKRSVDECYKLMKSLGTSVHAA